MYSVQMKSNYLQVFVLTGSTVVERKENVACKHYNLLPLRIVRMAAVVCLLDSC